MRARGTTCAGQEQYASSSPSVARKSVAEVAPSWSTASRTTVCAITGVEVCETSSVLTRLMATASSSRATARSSRSRIRPAMIPTMTPTMRKATSDSQSLGSSIANVW